MSKNIIIDPPLDGLDPVHRVTVRLADGLSSVEVMVRGADPTEGAALLRRAVNEALLAMDQSLVWTREEQTERWRNG